MQNIKFVETYNGLHFSVEFKDNLSVLNDLSGTGKTFLFKVLKEYCREHDISCIYCNYEFADYKKENIINLCKDNDIVIFDNADLYLTDEILEAVRNPSRLVVVSIKNLFSLKIQNAGYYYVAYDGKRLCTLRV